MKLTLVSHHLCPYVQRALIAAREAAVELEMVYIDLAAKPRWFLDLSPTGKTPLLRIERTGIDEVLFESAAIAEYFNDLAGGHLMPGDPLARAQHRAWIEFASGTLVEIAGLYNAPDAVAFDARRRTLIARLSRLEAEVAGPYFAGSDFTLVDAAFAPVFRYFAVFEADAGLYLSEDLPLSAWRAALARRPSVIAAALPDYPQRLRHFLLGRGSHLSKAIRGELAA